METEGYLQLIMVVFILIILILVFILYIQGARSNIDRHVIVRPGGKQQFIIGPGGQQWVNHTQHLLGPGGTQYILGPGGTRWSSN